MKFLIFILEIEVYFLKKKKKNQIEVYFIVDKKMPL